MKFKKWLSIVLTIAMIMSSFSFVIAEETEGVANIENTFDSQYFLDYAKELREVERPNLENVVISDQRFDDNAVKYQPDDEVRFIVEVAGTPLVKKEGKIVSGNETLLLSTQNDVINDLEVLDSSIEVRHRYTQGFNGFSISSKYKNLDEIKRMPGVVKIHIARKYELDMEYSIPIIKLQDTWETEGIKGEGTLIAIIDTGIDWTHTDFQKAPTSPKFSELVMTEKLRSTEENDYVYSEKVIAGWDFADKDNDVIPTGSDHGVHVAGTAAANGPGLVGVAPEAQLLAVKVFSDTSPWAYTDDIVAGIIYSVNLGADVINMSLGSVAGFVEPDGPYENAINLANDAGIVVAISAGNSNISTDPVPPYAINPDIGLVGSPSVSSGSFSVASYENTHVTAATIELGDGTNAIFAPGGIDPIGVLSSTEAYDYEYAGLGGEAADFTNADYTGKVALIMRGAYNFTDKILNAQAAGAVAAIIFNDEARGNALVNMATDPAITIPSIFIGYDDGANMRDESINRTVIFSGEVVSQSNPNEGKMSDFTSWGLTPNLEFKPEITAPGGNIWSTVTGDKYASMSGTSMAAPHIAGASALVLQELNTRGYVGLSRVKMAKILMMNTATPITVTGAVYQESPRRQGAGLLNVDAALDTPAFVVYADDLTAGISLKEIDNSTNFILSLNTFDDAPDSVTYNVYTSILTNEVSGGYLSMDMTNVDGALMTVNGTTVIDEVYYAPITIAKDSITPINFNIDLSAATGLDNSFVDGFIRFVPTDSTLPELSIPFVGFYGDWAGENAPSIVDKAHYEANAYMPYTGLYDWEDVAMAEDLAQYGWTLDLLVDYGYVAVKGSNAVFSPNNDAFLDAISSGFTLLRNARSFRMYVEDAEGTEVKEIFDNSSYEVDGELWYEEGLRKTVFADGAWVESGTAEFSWYGYDDEDNIAADGEYKIVLESKVDYPGASAQRQEFSIMLDTTAPTLSGIEVTEVTPDEEYTIAWTSEDELSGIYSHYVFVEGEYVGGTSDKSFAYAGTEPASVVVVVDDRAGNQNVTFVGDPVIAADAFTATAAGDYVSYLRPVTVAAEVDRPSTWLVEILDPQSVTVGTLTGAESYSFAGEWAPAEFAESGIYTARFTATDDELGTSVVEVQFDVYNYHTRIVNVEIQALDGTAIDSVARGNVVMVETEIENLGPNPVDPMIIIKITDSYGYLAYMGTVEYENLLADETKAVKTGFTIPNFKPKGEYTVEVYVWDGLDTMNPLSATVVSGFTVN